MAPIDIGGAPVSLQELLGFQKNVQASNPYGIAGGALGAWQPDMSTWSLPTQGITAFGKSFLSGILGNVARNDAADQLSKVVGSLPQLRADPQNAAIPEGVDPAGYNALRGSAVINKMQNEAASSAQRQSNMGDLLKTVVGEGVKAGTIEPGAALKAVATGDYSGVLGDKMDASANPNSPQYKQKMAIQSEEDAARNELLTGAKYPAIAKFRTTSTALSQLKDIKGLDTASSDIPFATLFIGGLDGSVVREGEYARVSGANPLLAKFQNQIEGALNGTSTLGVDIKKQMYNELVKTQKGLLAQSLVEAAPRLATGVARGGLPQNILPFDPQTKFDEMPLAAMDQKTFALDALAKGMTKEQARAAWAQYAATQGGGVY